MGKHWTDDENRICKYMWENGKSDEEISSVLKGRIPLSIKMHRIHNRWVEERKKVVLKVEKVEIEKPIIPPKHSDNLPDIGIQMVTLISMVKEMTVQLNDITIRLDAVVEQQKLSLELWRTIDARSKPTTRA